MMKKGLSLVEVLLAVALLAGLMTVLNILPGINLGDQNTRKSYALSVAKGVLDDYRALWLSPTEFENKTLPPLPTGLRYNCTIANPGIKDWTFDAGLNLQAVTIGDGNPVLLRTISVIVECKPGGSTSGIRVTLQTDIGIPEL